MGYLKTRCFTNKDKIEIKKYYDLNYGAKGEKRKKREKASPEQIVRQNASNRIRTLRRLIEHNFGKGDLFVTLMLIDYVSEPKKIMKKFITKLRNKYRLQKWTLKYIYVEEIGKKSGKQHWHMVINNKKNKHTDTVSIINQLWKELLQQSHPNFEPLDYTGEYGELSRYMLKEDAAILEILNSGQAIIRQPSKRGKPSYTKSRNVLNPPIKKETINATKWVKNPRPPKGYYIKPDSLYNGVNPVTGLMYQQYTLYRLNTDKKSIPGQADIFEYFGEYDE